MKSSKAGKSYVRPTIFGIAIFAIVFSHFAVSQFITFQTEKDSIITEAINKQAVEIKTEFKAPKMDTVTTQKKDVPVSPVSVPETDRIVLKKVEVKPTVIKKKEIQHESKAERLRRAEKLLTGV